MSASPLVVDVVVAPGSPADSRRARARRRGRCASTAGCRATSSSGGCGPTRPTSTLESTAAASSSSSTSRKRGRRAARGRGVERPVRPGPHVRQPLRVLLHLPAAQGPAPQPVPEGRRLPAELPVRELHDADPLHRGRPRAGRHRGPVAAARQHPRHRSRAAGPHAAQPARRHQPALAAGAARPRHRGARPGRRVPRRQRRRARSTTRWPASSTSTRSWPRWPSCRSASPASTPSRRCARTRTAEAAAVVDAVEDWQDVYRAALGRRLVHAADEYYLLAEPAVPRRRPLRGLHDARGRHRHGPHVRARVRRADRPTATGTAARLLRRRRRRHRSPRNRCRRTRPPTPACAPARAAPVRCDRAAQAPVGDPHRRARRPGRGAAGRSPRPRRRPRRPGRATSSSAATPASPA